MTFQFLPQSDGTLILRAYPEKADLLNVNFHYEYSSSANPKRTESVVQ